MLALLCCYSSFTTSCNLKRQPSRNVINIPNKARITLYAFVAVARSNKTAVASLKELVGEILHLIINCTLPSLSFQEFVLVHVDVIRCFI